MRFVSWRRVLTTLCGAALLCSLTVPASAFFRSKKADEPVVAKLTRNVMVGQALSFSPDDFPVSGAQDVTLSSITITALPDSSCGTLCMGSEPLRQDAVIQSSALEGLRFQAAPAPTVNTTGFSFLPTFSTGAQGSEVGVELHLLTEKNNAPIAENMSLSTYKNVPVTAYFQAVDSEGDLLTFQITSTPARGSVALAEDGTSRFVYTPYENKTGKDSFTYVAVDSAGNISNPAKVSVRIEKASTSVSYSDMERNSAHKAAVRLAEEGIFVGEYVNGQYFFRPDTPVSRSQFLAMAMSVAGLEPLEQVSLTGFADDAAIPTWAKGYVSSALKAGAICGSRAEDGQVVFCPENTITRAEATVMLNNLLDISDVAVQTWAAAGVEDSADSHWAMQAAVNLATAGVIRTADSSPSTLDTALTRADVAQMLDSSLDVLDARASEGWFSW